MPLLQPAHSLIQLRVSNKLLSGVAFGQTATFISLHHEQAASGECMAVIELLCQLYQLTETGELGAVVDIAGLGRYGLKFGSDNDTLVDAQTGETLADLRGLGQPAREEKVAEFSQDTMLQGDFFEQLRNLGLPGTIRQLIEHHIQQADALGRFA